MLVKKTKIEGPLLISPQIFSDERGFFLETYRNSTYSEKGIDVCFVQDNLSFSKKDTIRGLHYQKEPGQAKLITCLEGLIWDVVVDIRPHSPTFGQWEAFFLDSEKREQLFVPIGFAHGFCAIKTSLIQYKVSNIYNPQTECSILWNDPDLSIHWPVSHPILSVKDQTAPLLKQVFDETLDHR